MNTTAMRHIVAGALTSGAVAAAGLGLGAGIAAAQPPTGTWCPGQPLPMGGAAFGWDMNVCHTFYFDPNAPLTEPVIIQGQPPGPPAPPPPPCIPFINCLPGL